MTLFISSKYEFDGYDSLSKRYTFKGIAGKVRGLFVQAEEVKFVDQNENVVCFMKHGGTIEPLRSYESDPETFAKYEKVKSQILAKMK
jgi:hypothetical protein